MTDEPHDLIKDRDALEKQIETLQAEVDQLKGERAILVEGLNAIHWRLDLTLKQWEARKELK